MNKKIEKELIELYKFTEKEGFDPDRFYSFTKKALKAQRENMINELERLKIQERKITKKDETLQNMLTSVAELKILENQIIIKSNIKISNLIKALKEV